MAKIDGCRMLGVLPGKGYEIVRRIYDPNYLSPTITTRGGGQREVKILEDNPVRVRKLTPKECWRLMGFDDEDFAKAEKVNSKTQLYKQAGNSIVVNVLMEIFRQLMEGENA